MGTSYYPFQGTAGGPGGTAKAVGVKTDKAAELERLLIFVVEGIAFWVQKARSTGERLDEKTARFINRALASTAMDCDRNEQALIDDIREALKIRDAWRLKALDCCGGSCGCGAPVLPECANWAAGTEEKIRLKAADFGALTVGKEDIRSSRALAVSWIQGVAAYSQQAVESGFDDVALSEHIVDLLVLLASDRPAEELAVMMDKTGAYVVQAMLRAGKRPGK